MIEFHDPQAAVAIEHIPYTLGINFAADNSTELGLLANGFPDSENFLNHIGALLSASSPNINLHHYNKGNASIPASDKILAQIKGQCQAVITAWGH